MRTFKELWGVAARLVLAIVAVVAISAMATATAFGFPATTCVKSGKETVTYVVNGKTKTKFVYTGTYTESKCETAAPAGTYRANHEPEGKYEKITPSALSEGEQNEVKSLLKYVKVESSGIDSKPTVQVSGANVQIVNGSGQTETPNGAGNLVLGYDEKPGTQTGSHNLILAGIEDSFTSWGGILGGSQNKITGGFSSVLSGAGNSASKDYSVVVTGEANKASGNFSLVGGGSNNTASGLWSSVFGGFGQTATEEYETKP